MALENSLAGFKAALKHKVDEVELDVRLTKDGQVVVIHDGNTGRMSHTKLSVRRHTLAELKKIKLINGQKISTLGEVLELLGGTPVIIEMKDSGMAEKVLQIVRKHKKAKASYASFRHGEMLRLRELEPGATTYALDHLKPVEIVRRAREEQATGIGLNIWLANPLTHHLCKRYGLKFYVYPTGTAFYSLHGKRHSLARFFFNIANSRFLLAVFHRLYPDAAICTDRPDKLTR